MYVYICVCIYIYIYIYICIYMCVYRNMKPAASKPHRNSKYCTNAAVEHIFHCNFFFILIFVEVSERFGLCSEC